MKKNKYNILSFIIPLILLTTILLFGQVLNNKYSIFCSDLFGQYSKLLNNFKNMLNGDANIFYSFSKGMGGGMITTYAYYLLSPFNLLLVFFSSSNIHIFTIIIILLKISLCGTTMFTYLKYHFKGKDIYLLLFSTMYALSLYNIANYFQIMWLDGVLLAPLVLLGIDKLVKEKKSLLYGIALFLCILSNYYIGYMICIFSVIYFIYRSLLNKTNKEITIKFIIVSALAGLMTMYINVPNALSMLNGIRSTNEYMGLINTDIIGILSKTFIGAHNDTNILNISLPLLYCGIINYILIIFYYINKKIEKREKILSLSVLIAMLLSILVSPINYAWHLFSPPNCFNYRYIFLFVIFILYLSCKSLFNIKYINKKDYYIVGPIIPIIGLFIYLNNSLPLYLIYISVGIYLIYLVILYNIKEKGSKLLLVILVLAEIYFNIHIIFCNFDFLYNKYVFGRYNEKKESMEQINDDSFYRVEFAGKNSVYDEDENASYNDSYLYNYRGTSGWLSTLNQDSNFLFRMGYLTVPNKYRYQHYPVTDSLFGIKYYESSSKEKLYDVIYTHNVSSLSNQFYGLMYKTNYLYKNPYALSLGYMVDDVNGNISKTNGFESQSIIINHMTDLNLPVYSVNLIEDNYYKVVDDRCIYLMVMFTAELGSSEYGYSIYVNDYLYETADQYSYNVFVIDNYKVGDKVKIEVKDTNNLTVDNLLVYTFNEDNFIKHIDYLSKHQLNITEFKDGYVKGTINVGDDHTLFTTIPYERGWNVYVDGIKTNYYKIYDALIGVDLESGNHEIEFVYSPPGFKIGIVISSVSLISFVYYEIIEYKKRKL